jgi:hypothetical protein
MDSTRDIVVDAGMRCVTSCVRSLVMCSFTSFGFAWPPLLTKMFNVASMSSFNEQFLAPECSIGGWGFQLKWVPSCGEHDSLWLVYAADHPILCF